MKSGMLFTIVGLASTVLGVTVVNDKMIEIVFVLLGLVFSTFGFITIMKAMKKQ